MIHDAGGETCLIWTASRIAMQAGGKYQVWPPGGGVALVHHDEVVIDMTGFWEKTCDVSGYDV